MQPAMPTVGWRPSGRAQHEAARATDLHDDQPLLPRHGLADDLGLLLGAVGDGARRGPWRHQAERTRDDAGRWG